MRPPQSILLLGLAALCLLPTTANADSSCNCDTCTGNSLVAPLGTTHDIVSPTCPQGSVATITRLRTKSTSGEYEVTTWNEAVSLLSPYDPYVYREASTMPRGEEGETTCFEVADDVLPIVGDQREITVTLNCESIVKCDFMWDVQFGCAETGVLLENGGGGGAQVLSDIDDTIVCPNPSDDCDDVAECALEDGAGAAKSYLSGKDRRLDRREFYPGVAELMLGLSLGPGPTTYDVPSKPMLLSARPREASSVLAISQDSDLNLYMEGIGHINEFSWWGANVDSSMYGTILDGTSFLEFGQTKAKHYDAVSGDNANTRFVFMGDNGQGDVCGAQSMLESQTGGDRMVAVFIHLTEDPTRAITECESPGGDFFTLDLPEGDRVHYHRTHSDAARWALDRNLISCRSAAKVYRAVAEWHACRCPLFVDIADCPAVLPTGVAVPATRQETLSYCDDVEADQSSLLDALEGGGCGDVALEEGRYSAEFPAPSTDRSPAATIRAVAPVAVLWIAGALCAALL